VGILQILFADVYLGLGPHGCLEGLKRPLFLLEEELETNACPHFVNLLGIFNTRGLASGQFLNLFHLSGG